MADIIVDGMTRVDFWPAIADLSAPTSAEAAAAVRLDNVLIASGMEGFEASPGEVDNTSFSSRFDTKLPGVSAYSGSRLVVKKQSGTDTVFDALTEFGTTGFITVRDNVDADTDLAAADVLNIYPVTTGDWDYMSRERNSVLRYWVATPISDEPVKGIAIAA